LDKAKNISQRQERKLTRESNAKRATTAITKPHQTLTHSVKLPLTTATVSEKSKAASLSRGDEREIGFHPMTNE